MDDIQLEILPSGHIRFRRGNKEYNQKVRQIISFIVDENEDILKEIDDFLVGSEDTELLIGDTMFCG